MGRHQYQPLAGGNVHTQGNLPPRHHVKGIDHGVSVTWMRSAGTPSANRLLRAVSVGAKLRVAKRPATTDSFPPAKECSGRGCAARPRHGEGNFSVETGQGGRHHRGGVALGEHQGRLMPLQASVQPRHQAEVRAASAWFGCMTSRSASGLDARTGRRVWSSISRCWAVARHPDVPVAGAAQGQHHRCHLDGLRPGADHA